MTRIRIAGVMLLVLLGAGLLSRITDDAGAPKNPDRAPFEIPALESQPVTETVDLKTGNIHLQIPIRASRQKTTVPPLGH